MNKVSIYIVLLIGLILPSQTIMAKTLHAILVADTVHDISSITRPDLAKWQQELRVISKHTQMTLKEKSFSGREFQKDVVSNYIKDLAVGADDAVVFFFSGHGYRTAQKNTPCPFLMFEFYKQGIDLKWVSDTISDKKPRFALIMSDCCNNYVERGFTNEGKNIQVNLSTIQPNNRGYRQLFCNAKGCVLISSCSPGQFSYGSRFGGLYTQCFFASLNKELSEKTPSWKNLLQRANGYINHIQKPVCEISR